MVNFRYRTINNLKQLIEKPEHNMLYLGDYSGGFILNTEKSIDKSLEKLYALTIPILVLKDINIKKMLSYENLKISMHTQNLDIVRLGPNIYSAVRIALLLKILRVNSAKFFISESTPLLRIETVEGTAYLAPIILEDSFVGEEEFKYIENLEIFGVKI